MISQYI